MNEQQIAQATEESYTFCCCLHTQSTEGDQKIDGNAREKKEVNLNEIVKNRRDDKRFKYSEDST